MRRDMASKDYKKFMEGLLAYAKYEENPWEWVASYGTEFWATQYGLWAAGVRDCRVVDATCAVMIASGEAV